MAKIFDWFDDWKTERLDCPQCGWQGTVDMNETNEFEQLLDFRCPKCGKMVAIVNYPTLNEVREHWDSLSAEEQAFYGGRIKLDAEFEKSQLKSPAQLPDIEADPLILVWDIEFPSGGELAGDCHTTIKHEGGVIWRETAYYECVDRPTASCRCPTPTGRCQRFRSRLPLLDERSQREHALVSASDLICV